MKKIIIPMAIMLAFSIFSCNNVEKKDNKKAIEDSLKAIVEKAKEQSNKAKKEEETNEDVAYINDKNGQWAIGAQASSTYAAKEDKATSWSPQQMVGAPDVIKYGDNGKAWASKGQDNGEEWVILHFEKEVFATEVRVKETYNPGAIVKIELIDTKNQNHQVYDKMTPEATGAKMQYLIATFDKTKYKTKTVKITLNSEAVKGWNEIDAVQLVGE